MLAHGKFAKAEIPISALRYETIKLIQKQSNALNFEAVMDFEIYTKENIAELGGERLKFSEPSLQYLLPLVNYGSSQYAQNTNCEFGIVQIGKFYIPFSYNEKHKQPTYLTSLRAQFFNYLIEEIRKKKKFSIFFKLAIIPVLKLGNVIFRLFGSDNIVMLNNWLVSTNLIPNFSFLYFKPVLHDLTYEFENELIIFKGLNDKLHGDKIKELETIGFLPVVSRINFVLDVKEKSFKKKRPLEQDKKRWDKQNSLHWHEPSELSEEEKKAIIAHYKNLYIDKHSSSNPAYRSEFLDAALKSKFLKIELLRDENGDILGVQALASNESELTTPFIGYDQKAPKELGLYRHLNVKLVNDAEQGGKILNMSSGAGKFKQQRGGEPMVEYHMIYINHLPIMRRIFWRVFSNFSVKYIKPLLIKSELE